MPTVKVLRKHAAKNGIDVYAVGDVYTETPIAAQQKADAGFVEIVPSVRTKESQAVYRKPVTLKSHSGNWYHFSDGEKVLGKTKAAERLGITVEELEAMTAKDGEDG